MAIAAPPKDLLHPGVVTREMVRIESPGGRIKMSTTSDRTTTTHDIGKSALQASLGDLFVLERELDGAGMSQVFVAEERALGRKVVIKVLARQPTAELS